MENDYFLKQVIANHRGQYEEAKAQVSEAVRQLYRKGRQVIVTKGNGSWEGTIECAAFLDNCFIINIQHNRTGKHHNIHMDCVELITAIERIGDE